MRKVYSERQLDPRDGMSPEEEDAYERDVKAAMDLLAGRYQATAPGRIAKWEFLSVTTKPTEKEARAALRRVLERQNVPNCILIELANLFDPSRSEENQRTVFFQKCSQGHADPMRDFLIQMHVDAELYDWVEGERGGEDVRNLKTLEQAYEIVAERASLSPEQVKRVYLRMTKQELARRRAGWASVRNQTRQK